MAAEGGSADIQYEEDHINETRVPELITVLAISLVIAYSAVALRLFSRRLSNTALKYDDWTIMLSLV